MAVNSMEDVGLSPQSALPVPSKPAGTVYGIHANLPDKPLVTIEPIRSWSAFDVRELWAHRELLYFLTLRDLKVRYKQTLLGAVWVILQPLLLTLVFTVFLGLVARITTPGIPYPIFVYSGLLLWMFISGGISGCSASLTGNANLLTKVYFPRILLPAAYLGTRIVDFVISLFILAILLAFYRWALHYPVTITWKLAAFAPILFLMIIFTFSLGTLVASLNVRYRDVSVALPVLIQLWMFTSPIVYPPERVPAKWQTLYSLNPLVGLIQGFRAALLGTKFPMFALAITVFVTVILFGCAAFVFRQTEKGFADVL